MPRREEEIEYVEEFASETEVERLPRRAKVGVLYCDEELIVANKPPGVWLDQSPADEPSIAEQLVVSGVLPADAELRMVYPLDPPVSGVVIVPRCDTAADSLAGQAESGELRIVCTAIVRGPVMQDIGRIESRLGVVEYVRGGRMRIDNEGGRETVTEWVVRDRFVGYALLECRTRPALPHQIRLQLESAGIPLAVDPQYGGAMELRLSSFKAGYRRSKRHFERPLIDRVSLHVESIAFLHPCDGRAMTFIAPAPKDFRAAVHQLGRFGRMPK